MNAVAAVAAAFPRDHGLPQTWPQAEQLLPHANGAQHGATAAGKARRQLVRLLNSTSDYLFAADSAARGLDVAIQALSHSKGVFGPEHSYMLHAGTILANSHRAAGRIGDAIQLGERVLADCERVIGAEHRRTFRAGVMLALSYGLDGAPQDRGEHGEQQQVACRLGRWWSLPLS